MDILLNSKTKLSNLSDKNKEILKEKLSKKLFNKEWKNLTIDQNITINEIIKSNLISFIF